VLPCFRRHRIVIYSAWRRGITSGSLIEKFNENQREIIMKFFIAAIFAAIVTPSVFAQGVDCLPRSNRAGIFANVSASGIASKSKPMTACTIINSKESIDSTTVFLTESSSGDAVMEIFYVREPSYPAVANMGIAVNLFPKRFFDNWTDTISTNETRLLESKLRLPNSSTDAIALMTSDADYYNFAFAASLNTIDVNAYSFGVCATGYPKDGEAWTNVQITNLGPSKSNACYTRSGVFFEK